MSAVLLVVGFVTGLALVVLRGVLSKELQGQFAQRITARVDTTIASLPEELQAQYADEWRAELAAVIEMPITATQFARGLRSSAEQLRAEFTPTPAAADDLRETARGRAVARSRLVVVLDGPKVAGSLRHTLHDAGDLVADLAVTAIRSVTDIALWLAAAIILVLVVAVVATAPA